MGNIALSEGKSEFVDRISVAGVDSIFLLLLPLGPNGGRGGRTIGPRPLAALGLEEEPLECCWVELIESATPGKGNSLSRSRGVGLFVGVVGSSAMGEGASSSRLLDRFCREK